MDKTALGKMKFFRFKHNLLIMILIIDHDLEINSFDDNNLAPQLG